MTKFECGKPRAVVVRLLFCLKGGKERDDGLDERKGNRRRKEKCGGEEELRDKCIDLVTESTGSCECVRHTVEGGAKNETTFALGAGFGIAFLIASSKIELNKMMELREQMESLVQNVKDDVQSIDKVSKSTRANMTTDYSTTDVEESMNSNGYFSHTDYTPCESRVTVKFQQQDSKQHVTRDTQIWSNLNRKDMEIELESELKHLQLLCESDEHEEHSSQRDGVPPEELALRLHELLESKQEERIKELEYALTHALQKLDEKESEASWWKETAQLFSQHLPGPANTSSSRHKSVLPAPHCPKRSIKLAEKLSNEILMNP